MTVTVGLSSQADADVLNNAGNATGNSFSITRFSLGLGAPIRLNEDWMLRNSIRFGIDSYDFSGVGVAPWDDINTLSAATIAMHRASGEWSYYFGGFVKMSAESGASLEDGFNAGVLGGVNYKVNDTLSIGGGLVLMSQIEDGGQVLPLITAKWKFAEQWVLNAGLTDVSTAGYGIDAKWMFNQDWDFTFGLQTHKSRFRIEGVGATKDAVAQEQSTLLFAQATWHATPKIDVSGFLGMATGGKLKVDDRNGNLVGEQDYDSAGVIGVKASLKF